MTATAPRLVTSVPKARNCKPGDIVVRLLEEHVVIDVERGEDGSCVLDLGPGGRIPYEPGATVTRRRPQR